MSSSSIRAASIDSRGNRGQATTGLTRLDDRPGLAQQTGYEILPRVADLLWTPSQDRISAATITRYQAWLANERGLRFESYEDLWRWSVDDLTGFWSSIAEFCGVRFSEEPSAVLGRSEMPGAEWFPGSRVSYVEHIFRDRTDDDVALFHASELRPLDSWTWGELRSHVAAIAAGLRGLGVGPGDRVAAYLPNIAETVAAFCACASIGAVWSSAAPEFGARSVIDRFAQIEPKVLLAVDGYRYGGKDFDRREVVEQIAAEIGTARVVRLGYLDGSGWEQGFLGSEAEPLEFAALAFDHPLWVLYSSGTTGLPKPIVHGQGGILLEQLKKTYLHLDAKPGDRVLLVLDHRLDDVELPRRGAAGRVRRSCCSTATRAIPTWGRCGIWPSRPR